MHSTHFIYGYMASDIWLRTILIVRKETCCRHIGYSFRLAARVLLYAPSHRQDSTYHCLCYTSRGALAGTWNSPMGPSHEGSMHYWEVCVILLSIIGKSVSLICLLLGSLYHFIMHYWEVWVISLCIIGKSGSFHYALLGSLGHFGVHYWKVCVINLFVIVIQLSLQCIMIQKSYHRDGRCVIVRRVMPKSLTFW